MPGGGAVALAGRREASPRVGPASIPAYMMGDTTSVDYWHMMGDVTSVVY
jgi:hypothetical protein